jgi:hypothetical protein
MFRYRFHLGKGRRIVKQQKIHFSVLSLGEKYKLHARLPEGHTLSNLLESDAFENTRSILGSLLSIGPDGAEQAIVLDNIDCKTTELLKHVDRGVFPCKSQCIN